MLSSTSSTFQSDISLFISSPVKASPGMQVEVEISTDILQLDRDGTMILALPKKQS